MKICVKCKEEKELIDFYKNKISADGLRNDCKNCNNNLKKEYYKNNIIKIKQQSIEYRLKNKIERQEYDKNYRILNKEKIKEKSRVRYNSESGKEKAKQRDSKYYKNNKKEIIKRNCIYVNKRKLIDPLFKLRHNISSLIYNKFNQKNGYTKKSKTSKYLGCSFQEFKIHLESQFTKGMTWDNQGQWHMDHIYPVSLAKDEDELIKLNHYTNFQPLWAIDNLKKGNKIIEKQLTLI